MQVFDVRSLFEVSASCLKGVFMKLQNIRVMSHPRALIFWGGGGLFHTLTCGAGGFQRYHKSFKIGHKPFYSQVNDLYTIHLGRFPRFVG